MRLLDLLETSAQYYAKNSVESPRLTAELMLAHVLGKTRMQLYMEFESDVPEEKLALLRPLAKRRAEGIPLEYVLGFKDFAGRRFKVSPDVLIPRPETELLLEKVVTLIEPGAGPIVDVGTGSGVLAVSIAAKFPELPVYALDISPNVLAIASENGASLSNITWIESDLLVAWKEPRAQMIVANLPYIPSGQIATLSREVRNEPTLALDGGEAGLDLIDRLIGQALGRTRYLALEIGDGQAEEVKALLEKNQFKVNLVIEDLRKVPRIVIGEELR